MTAQSQDTTNKVNAMQIAAMERQIEDLESRVTKIIGDRDRALLWGILTLGAAVVGMAGWIFTKPPLASSSYQQTSDMRLWPWRLGRFCPASMPYGVVSVLRTSSTRLMYRKDSTRKNSHPLPIERQQ